MSSLIGAPCFIFPFFIAPLPSDIHRACYLDITCVPFLYFSFIFVADECSVSPSFFPPPPPPCSPRIFSCLPVFLFFVHFFASSVFVLYLSFLLIDTYVATADVVSAPPSTIGLSTFGRYPIWLIFSASFRVVALSRRRTFLFSSIFFHPPSLLPVDVFLLALHLLTHDGMLSRGSINAWALISIPYVSSILLGRLFMFARWHAYRTHGSMPELFFF